MRRQMMPSGQRRPTLIASHLPLDGSTYSSRDAPSATARPDITASYGTTASALACSTRDCNRESAEDATLYPADPVLGGHIRTIFRIVVEARLVAGPAESQRGILERHLGP